MYVYACDVCRPSPPFHSFNPITPPPKTAFEDYLQAWNNVLSIFGAKWNVFAIDLKV